MTQAVTILEKTDFSFIEHIEQTDLSALLADDLRWQQNQIFPVNLAPSVEKALMEIGDRYERDREAKILALNCPSLDIAIEALARGASAVIDLALPLGQIPQIETALQQESVYIRLDSPFFIVLPRNRFGEEIELRSFSIASQIVNYWRSGAGEQLQFDLQDWGIESLREKLLYQGQNKSLRAELSAIMENFASERVTKPLAQCDRVSSFLARWFLPSKKTNNCALGRLKKNYHRLHKSLSQKLSHSCLLWERSTGSYQLSLFLNQTIALLQDVERQLERSQHQAALREFSVIDAISRFKEQLAQNDYLGEDYYSLLRGMKLQYQLEIEIRSFQMSGLLVNYLTELLRDYRDLVVLGDNFFYQIQQEFESNLNPQDPIYLAGNLDYGDKLREELILQFGSFLGWGLSPLLQETLKLKILETARNQAIQTILSTLKSYD